MALGENTKSSSAPLAGEVRRVRSMILKRKRLRIVRKLIVTQSKLNGRRIISPTINFSKVTLAVNSPAEMRVFESAVLREESVLECYQVIGAFDYLLKVAMPSDVKESLILKGVLGNLSNVREISWFARRNVVSHGQRARQDRHFRNLNRLFPFQHDNVSVNDPRLQPLCSGAADEESESIEAASSSLSLMDMLANTRTARFLSAFIFVRSARKAESTSAAIEFLAWHDCRILEFHQLSYGADFILKISVRCIRELARTVCADIISLPGAVEAKCYLVVRQVKHDIADVGATSIDPT